MRSVSIKFMRKIWTAIYRYATLFQKWYNIQHSGTSFDMCVSVAYPYQFWISSTKETGHIFMIFFFCMYWHGKSSMITGVCLYIHTHMYKSFIEVYLIYNIVILSAVQQGDSVIHTSILFQFLFPYRLLPNIGWSSLCYRAGHSVYHSVHMPVPWGKRKYTLLNMSIGPVSLLIVLSVQPHLNLNNCATQG